MCQAPPRHQWSRPLCGHLVPPLPVAIWVLIYIYRYIKGMRVDVGDDDDDDDDDGADDDDDGDDDE